MDNVHEFPWPRRGDSLFKSDDDWWNNACLNWSHDMRYAYSLGYKRAGDILVEHVSNSESDQDTLVYPIVFAYRHYIELEMKNLIRDGRELLGVTSKAQMVHGLDVLWQECRRLLDKVWPDGPREDLDAVQECISQLTEVDPTSTAFRYSTDRSDNPSLPGLTHINLRNLAEIIDRLGSFFDGAGTGISAMLEAKREIENDYPRSR